LGLEDEAPPALDHVQVAAPAGCEARARWFYGELLGLDEVEKPSPLRGRGGVWFALASGAQLHVGVADRFVAAAKAHPGLRVASVDALEAVADRLRGGGAPVTWDEELPRVRRFFTADPFGNRLELLAPQTSENGLT
jgi:catechol 2,3-dioxygenase-like lactoylglutathione lyase family enzyme